jgi:hypothetical protein
MKTFFHEEHFSRRLPKSLLRSIAMDAVTFSDLPGVWKKGKALPFICIKRATTPLQRLVGEEVLNF